MKKLTVLLPDDARLDLMELSELAISMHLEKIPDDPKIKRNVFKEKSVKSTIMKHFSPGAMFTIKIAGKWVEDEGYNPRSASSALSELSRAGHLKHDEGRGEYSFLKPIK